MQSMLGQNRMLLLSGFIIVMTSLQGSAAYKCSVEYTVSHYNCSVEYPGDRFFSYSVHSAVEVTAERAVLYVLIDLLPLMFYFPILILFNWNLASGPARSVIFFYQVLPATLSVDDTVYGRHVFLCGLITMKSPINDRIFGHILPYLALQYFKVFAVVVALVMTLMVVRCSDCVCASWRHPWAKLRRCVRNFREKRAQKGTVLHGLCSIAILTYGFVIQLSVYVFKPAYCANGTCTAKTYLYYCNEWTYHTVEYILCLSVALVCLVFSLLLPLLLLYYPCVPDLVQRVTKRSSALVSCHKVAPVFDVFQSAYKPKLRFFAAIRLIYHVIIYGFLLQYSEADKSICVHTTFIVILGIHCLVQPYSKARHNYIEALLLVNLVLISTLSILFRLTTFQCLDSKAVVNIIAALYIILEYLPLIVASCYLLWNWKCCQRCRAACYKRVNHSQTEPDQGEAVQVSRSEVYYEMNEAKQMEQD